MSRGAKILTDRLPPVRISPNEKKILEAAAIARNKSKSQLIREFILSLNGEAA